MVNRPRRSKVVSPMCGGADTTGSPKRAVVRGSFTFKVKLEMLRFNDLQDPPGCLQ